MAWFYFLVLVLIAYVVVVRVVLPELAEAVERAQRRRAVAEASWLIHQRASAAFAQMLETARELHRDDEAAS